MPAKIHRFQGPKLERMFKHIFESALHYGKLTNDEIRIYIKERKTFSPRVQQRIQRALRIASATVNKYRAKLSRSGKGPRLVGQGGSRSQWYPGKERARKNKGGQVIRVNFRLKAKRTAMAAKRVRRRRGRFVCASHGAFKTLAGLRSHQCSRQLHPRRWRSGKCKKRRAGARRRYRK